MVTGGGGWWWWQVRQNLEKQIGVEDLGYLFWHQPIGRGRPEFPAHFDRIHESLGRCAIATTELAVEIALHRLVKIRRAAIMRCVIDTLSTHDGSTYDGSRHDGSRHDGSTYDGSRHDGHLSLSKFFGARDLLPVKRRNRATKGSQYIDQTDLV